MLCLSSFLYWTFRNKICSYTKVYNGHTSTDTEHQSHPEVGGSKTVLVLHVQRLRGVCFSFIFTAEMQKEKFKSGKCNNLRACCSSVHHPLKSRALY